VKDLIYDRFRCNGAARGTERSSRRTVLPEKALFAFSEVAQLRQHNVCSLTFGSGRISKEEVK
jgi:hypothetical protein